MIYCDRTMFKEEYMQSQLLPPLVQHPPHFRFPHSLVPFLGAQDTTLAWENFQFGFHFWMVLPFLVRYPFFYSTPTLNAISCKLPRWLIGVERRLDPLYHMLTICKQKNEEIRYQLKSSHSTKKEEDSDISYNFIAFQRKVHTSLYRYARHYYTHFCTVR